MGSLQQWENWQLIECCSLVAKIPRELKFMKKNKSGSKFSKSSYSYQLMYLNRKNSEVVFHIILKCNVTWRKNWNGCLSKKCMFAAFPPLLLHKGHICIKCMGSWSQIKWSKLNYSIPSCEELWVLWGTIRIATLYFLFIHTTLLLYHCGN